MRIVAVCGSFREESNTNKLIRTVAEASGIECEFIELGGLKIQPCSGCSMCMMNEGVCPIDDDMQAVYPRLLAADAIVFASPIYWFTYSAQLKLCIDRMYALNSKQGHALRGKKVGVVLTYGDDDLYTSGGINAIYTFESMARYVKFEIVDMVYGTANEIGDAQKQPVLMEKAATLGQRLATGG